MSHALLVVISPCTIALKKYSIQKLLFLIMPCAKKIKMYIITSPNTQIISDRPWGMKIFHLKYEQKFSMLHTNKTVVFDLCCYTFGRNITTLQARYCHTYHSITNSESWYIKKMIFSLLNLCSYMTITYMYNALNTAHIRLSTGR